MSGKTGTVIGSALAAATILSAAPADVLAQNWNYAMLQTDGSCFSQNVYADDTWECSSWGCNFIAMVNNKSNKRVVVTFDIPRLPSGYFSYGNTTAYYQSPGPRPHLLFGVNKNTQSGSRVTARVVCWPPT